jgi:hypothetical protein
MSILSKKNKPTKVTWYKEGDFFYVKINGKVIDGEIPCSWVGDSLLIYLNRLDKNYLLLNYANISDNEEHEAAYAGDGNELFWSKQGDGFYFYEQGLNINTQTDSYWLDTLFIVAYNDEAFLLQDYSDSPDDTLFLAVPVTEPDSISWVRVKDGFFMLQGAETITLENKGSYCNEHLIIYLNDLAGIYLLPYYQNAELYTFYKAHQLAGKDEFVYYKKDDNKYELFCNYENLGADSVAIYNDDDIIIYLPDRNTTLILPSIKQAEADNFYLPQVLSGESNVFWSTVGEGYKLIDRGVHIAHEVGDHFSWIGKHVLIYHPPTTSTYLLQDYGNLKDNKLRPALLVSDSAQFIWKAANNKCFIWYQARKVGDCEYQMVGNDLMVMPKSLKKMLKLENFAHRQDNVLRIAEVEG